MTGAIECSAVDEARCEGGRCCTFTGRDPATAPVRDWEAEAAGPGAADHSE